MKMHAFRRTMILFTISASLCNQASASVSLVQVMASSRTTYEHQENQSLPGLLVIATDHGEGSSLVTHTIGAHPCFVDAGEPFDSDKRWYNLYGFNSMFKRGMEPARVKRSDALQNQLNKFFAARHQTAPQLDPNLHLGKTLTEYFLAVREEACAHLELDEACRGRCVLVHKLFPIYFSYDFEKAHDYLMDPRVMVLQVKRDINATIQSNNERFGSMGKPAIEGLVAWNKYLNDLGAQTDKSKVWETIDMDDHILANTTAFFSEIEHLYTQFKFDKYRHDTMMAPVQAKVDEMFSLYAMKKANMSGHISKVDTQPKDEALRDSAALKEPKDPQTVDESQEVVKKASLEMGKQEEA